MDNITPCLPYLRVGWTEAGLLFTLVSLFACYVWTSAYTYWKRRNVPYLQPKFPFGNTGDMLLMRKTFRDSWQEIYDQLGDNPYGGIYSISTPLLVVKDPALIKSVLTKDFNHFTDHGVFPRDRANYEPLFNNIFNMEGDTWKKTRMKLLPTFTSRKLKLMFPLLEECARDLKLFFRNEKTFEAKDLMSRFTCDAVVNCVLGLRAAAVNNTDAEMFTYGKRMFARSLWRSLSNVMLVEAPTLYRFLGMHFLGYDECENIASIVQRTIQFREKHKTNSNDFLDLIIKIKKNLSTDDKQIQSLHNDNNNGIPSCKLDKAEKAMTTTDLLSQAVGFFIAAFETSSSALAYCLYELARNPEVQITLQRELDETIERDGGINYHTLQELPYANNVISETLRMYSSLSVLNRICVKAYRIPESDVVIERGCKIIIPMHAIHQDARYYPDPTKFDPDRFLNENVRSRPSHTFLAFGEGPRMCIGVRFARMEIKLALATLFSDFNVTLNPNTPVPLTFERGDVFTTTKNKILLDLCDRNRFSP